MKTICFRIASTSGNFRNTQIGATTVTSKRIDWNGVFAVMVTPFTEDGLLDESAMRQLIDLLIAEGVDGIVLAGSTGEWQSLSDDERIKIFRVGVDQARGRVKLIGGTSALNTPTVVNLTKAAKDIGLDGVMVLPPPYVMPTRREVRTFFEAVDAVGIPIMLYNNPTRTGVNLDAGFLQTLVDLPNIVSIKDSVKDLAQMSATLRAHGDTLAVFTGLETYTIPALQRGADGVVAMSPNVLGVDAVGFVRAAKNGHAQRATIGQYNTDLLYEAMYGGGVNPYVVLKEAMRLLGRPGGWPRAPLVGMLDSERNALAEVLDRIRSNTQSMPAA
jgi:4-hydroxy-tetrahydrodipicolinate synthase